MGVSNRVINCSAGSPSAEPAAAGTAVAAGLQQVASNGMAALHAWGDSRPAARIRAIRWWHDVLLAQQGVAQVPRGCTCNGNVRKYSSVRQPLVAVGYQPQRSACM